ncbi:neuralized-like protein 4 [Littorina saxatilis]|uniref:neuralized-like protein 4 n=1 Tax=Littorina saxatilis TaxID=31220 RepID=UPI0038B5477D
MWTLMVGVVTTSTDGLTLPSQAYGCRRAVVVERDRFSDHGSETLADIGRPLYNLPVDSRVGVSLDPSRRLHLHVNGVDQGVVPCQPLPDPCWAMWDLDSTYTMVKACPVTNADHTS